MFYLLLYLFLLALCLLFMRGASKASTPSRRLHIVHVCAPFIQLEGCDMAPSVRIVAEVCYAPSFLNDPKPFLVRLNGKVSDFLPESMLAIVGDADINSAKEEAKYKINQWVPITRYPSRTLPAYR